ncbi:MAG: hypothetical protein LBJ74_02725 [Heliobacteriaceae bacterium]|jgi:hypothetical protein|nr:hypothetical protein [Heliobacteriaceae bacterium]
MFSPEFMRFLINYQKPEKQEVSTVREIKFRNRKRGLLAEVFVFSSK